MKLRKLLAAVTFATASVLATAPAQSAPTVGLYLAMDGSGSISGADFTTQINGYVNALNSVFGANPSFFGKVAIGGSIFGANVSQFFAVQTIADATVLASLTGAIGGLNPGRGGINTGATAIGDAVASATSALLAFETAQNTDLRLVIDVTTDGQNNTGQSPVTAASNATAGGINAVNCLGIGASASCTWIGSNGTNFGTVSFANLSTALAAKIQQEVTGVPEPGTLALLGLGLAGLAAVRRRKESNA